jgi:hypothetical protein
VLTDFVFYCFISFLIVVELSYLLYYFCLVILICIKMSCPKLLLLLVILPELRVKFSVVVSSS